MYGKSLQADMAAQDALPKAEEEEKPAADQTAQVVVAA